MADKQIRVTTDTSAIERFKVEADELYRNLRKYSKDYLTASESDIDAIVQRHEKLLNLYRELDIANSSRAGDRAFQRLDYQFTENNINRNRYQEQHSQVDPDSNSRKTILEQIRDTLNKIFNKDQTVGGRSLRPEDDTDPFRRMSNPAGGGGAVRSDVQGGLQAIASGDIIGGFGKLLGLAGVGAIGAGLAKAFQEAYQTQTSVYGAGSSIERELERLNVWRYVPFSARGRNVDTARHNLEAYWNNRGSQYQMALMSGVGIDSAFNQQIAGSSVSGSVNDPKYSRALSQAIKTAGAFGAGGAGIGTAFNPGIGTAIGGGIGAFAGFLTGAGVGAWNEYMNNKIPELEVHNRGSVVLGKNISEMTSDLYDYRRAAVTAENADVNSIWQSMLAEKIYGLDRGALTGVYGVNRYQNGALRADRVASDVLATLKTQTFDPFERSIRLQEGLNTYTQVANSIIGQTGSFDSNTVKNIIQGLTARGVQGQNLTSLAQAFAGNTMSSGDVSRALIMQAAAMSGNGGSLLDLQAELEHPERGTMKTLLGNLWNMSGGNKDFFETTLASTLGISASKLRTAKRDAARKGRNFLYDKNGNLDIDSIYDSGLLGQDFLESDAASMVTDQERSEAGTANRNIVGGKLAQDAYQRGDEDWFKSFKNIDKNLDALLDKANGEGINVNMVNVAPKAVQGGKTSVVIKNSAQKH
jgi:hypothetical protein